VSSKTKKGGLGEGVNALFKRGEEAPSDTEKPSKPEKYRTTVMLYPDTLSNIELLKADARKQGVKATMSDILNDAVQLLAKERQIQLD
jgi:hypothetical protein